MEFLPGLPKIMQANRAFMRRAVRFAAVRASPSSWTSVRHPTFGNVHEVAQAAVPDARVMYVDHDPVAVAHSQAVLEGDDGAGVVAADLRKPREILDSPEVLRLIDLNRPVALLLVAILQLRGRRGRPVRGVAELRQALAPGSMLVLTHRLVRGDPAAAERAEGAVACIRTFAPADHAHARRDRAVLRGVRHGGTGLVPMPRWRPDTAPEDEDPYAFLRFAGVGVRRDSRSRTGRRTDCAGSRRSGAGRSSR
ncbi:SAM-dependent methyltransferase [Streptomyces heliomycini]